MFEHREEGHGDLYEPAVPLPEMAAKALDVLSQDRDGFFVLIEEEAIDEMAHENNAGLMIKSGAALDATVKVAVDFARRHPGTLIVVQGDHETGGLTIENPDDADESGEELSREDGPFTVNGTGLQVFADWTTGGHTGADTPITAERSRLGRLRRRDRQHRRPRRDRGRDAQPLRTFSPRAAPMRRGSGPSWPSTTTAS